MYLWYLEGCTKYLQYNLVYLQHDPSCICVQLVRLTTSFSSSILARLFLDPGPAILLVTWSMSALEIWSVEELVREGDRLPEGRKEEEEEEDWLSRKMEMKGREKEGEREGETRDGEGREEGRDGGGHGWRRSVNRTVTKVI